jgi:hypothetical protein
MAHLVPSLPRSSVAHALAQPLQQQQSNIIVNTALQQQAYTPTTLTLYRNAVHSFLAWTDTQHLNISTIPQLDKVLNNYIVHLYQAGQGKATAVKTVYGIIMYMPEANKQLHNTSKSLQGWSRIHRPVSYPPLSWDMCVLISCQLARAGYWNHAVGCLLSFDCYLRVGELCGIQHADVADIGDSRVGSSSPYMCIRLAHTKTGPNKWVTVRNATVTAFMRSLLASSHAGNHPLFGFSSSNFRDTFKAACVAVGVAHVGYVPHSLRHGGATHDHIHAMPLEDIMLRGRWASNKSARMYIQTGRALLLTQAVPSSVLASASVFARDVHTSMLLSFREAQH